MRADGRASSPTTRAPGLEPRWFGLTYINVIWQEKMVFGHAASAFLGSFVVVLVMMSLLFRSPLWGLLSMIPLTLTIGLIYGVIGLIGKDYDMPVAVLSALTLGLAVDFAIHFPGPRARALLAQTAGPTARPPCLRRAGAGDRRNVIVIAVGFTPLLAAPLVPYNTVGVFLAAILFVSGLATLLDPAGAAAPVRERRCSAAGGRRGRRPPAAATPMELIDPDVS